MSKEEYVKICPKCGSVNVTSTNGIIGEIGLMQDQCKDCGNVSIFPEVQVSSIPFFKKLLK